MEIEDILGKRMKAIDIFTMVIRYIMEHMMEGLTKREQMKDMEIRSEDDIHWLFTVPAIWDDLSKRFLNTAANDAGIPDGMLSLPLESEAALVYCLEEGMITAHVGCRYMVLDLGGDTCNIIVYEVKHDGSLEVLHQPTGGDFGGTNVDNKFIDVLVRIFGADIVKHFKCYHMQAYWELMNDFKEKIKKFDGTGRMILRFPTSLLEIYEEEVGFKLEASLLHTGFEVSPYLQSEMRGNFDNLIVLPEEPFDAMLEGAVLYGHDPRKISPPICKKTWDDEV
ncbi:HS12A-like protein [Mya arenaria]|uniref:HS12A-like protein n=1 Tax=Mya arenaria TaxID=6604 RepID=A0ABY7DSU1_MYAAR|nr:HS12A-like protein [Mya arenaria]